MYEGSLDLQNKKKSEVKRDNTRHYPCNCNFSINVEPYFIYEEAGKKHIVYYQDAAATRARLELISKYRHLVKGITFWRLGDEDPEIWEVVAEYSRSITGEI
jgi:spore germination protein YaaH